MKLLNHTHSLKMFRSVFDALTDAIFIFDGAGQLLQINAEAYSLLQRISPVPDRVRSRISMGEHGWMLPLRDEETVLLSDDQLTIVRLLQSAVLQTTAIPDYRLRTSQDEEIILHLSGSSLCDEREEVVGVLVVCRDETERHQQEQRESDTLLDGHTQTKDRLDLVNNAQKNLIALVSHEFRSALTSVQGFSEMICDEETSVLEMKDYAAVIREEAMRLHRMINEMLDLERMRSGKVELRTTAVDLNKLLLGVVQRMRLTSPFSIEMRFDNSLPHVLADSDKIIQVCTNLLSNAIKYSPDGGLILVSSDLDAAERCAHVKVQDYGIGIPAYAIEQIFEPYNRVESRRSRSIKGTGLGLSIVRHIVGLHGGKVWADSTPEQGSIFHFTLPLVL